MLKQQYFVYMLNKILKLFVSVSFTFFNVTTRKYKITYVAWYRLKKESILGKEIQTGFLEVFESWGRTRTIDGT